MAAGKRDRTGQQTHQRIQPQQLRHADTERVLQQQQAHHHNQESAKHFAARPQTGKVSVKADSGEERQHQRVLQAHIEIDFDIHAFFQNQQRQRHQQAAGDGFRNGIFFEEWDVLNELSP